MGSYTVSTPRGTTIAAAADMLSPGAAIKAMPGDVPKTTPIAMVKSKPIKVTKVKNIQHVVAEKFNTDKRQKLAKKKQAEPDGSFPIRNKKDLSNAKKDIGRAGNKASDRAWINKRAKQLGEPGLNAGGPGSGRHQEFVVNTPDEVDEKHKELLKKGFKYQQDGSYKNEYGRTANIFMKKRIAAGGPGSGRRSEGGPAEHKSMARDLIKMHKGNKQEAYDYAHKMSQPSKFDKGGKTAAYWNNVKSYIKVK